MFSQFAALGIRDEWCVFLFFAYLFVSLNFDNASVFALLLPCALLFSHTVSFSGLWSEIELNDF